MGLSSEGAPAPPKEGSLPLLRSTESSTPQAMGPRSSPMSNANSLTLRHSHAGTSKTYSRGSQQAARLQSRDRRLGGQGAAMQGAAVPQASPPHAHIHNGQRRLLGAVQSRRRAGHGGIGVHVCASSTGTSVSRGVRPTLSVAQHAPNRPPCSPLPGLPFTPPLPLSTRLPPSDLLWTGDRSPWQGSIRSKKQGL